jgi:hypothetical protein
LPISVTYSFISSELFTLRRRLCVHCSAKSATDVNCVIFTFPFLYTVSWWVRILNCIEEVPQVHFSIQCKFKLEFFNWCQLIFKLIIAMKYGGYFLGFFVYCIQHCFICRPSDSTVLTDAGIEPRTVAIIALAVRRSSH